MGADLAAVARLLASPARAAIIEALLDGQPHTAGELAIVGQVGAAATSEHLALLMKGKLISVTRRGRHRHYALANRAVASAIEAFAQICPPRPVVSLRQSSKAKAFAQARTCYDHLAGRLGVAVCESIVLRGWLVRTATGFDVTRRGEQRLEAVGVDFELLRARRRTFARACTDLTEKQPHLGGALGAALTTAVLRRGWIRRGSIGRGVMVTRAGEVGLTEVFGVDLKFLADGSAGQQVRPDLVISTRFASLSTHDK